MRWEWDLFLRDTPFFPGLGYGGNVGLSGGITGGLIDLPLEQCGNGGMPFSSGAYAGVSAEAGIAVIGAAGQHQYSVMSFTNGEGAIYATSGAFIAGPGYGISTPPTPSVFSGSAGGVVIGATIGADAGLVFSNARKADDLTGNAQTYNVNLGALSASASFGENGIFSVSAGPSVGFSFDVSTYVTSTTIVHRDTGGCR
jgi:hypothetical protein